MHPQTYYFPCGACLICFCGGAVGTQTRWCWPSPSVIYFPNFVKQPKISFWEKEPKGEKWALTAKVSRCRLQMNKLIYECPATAHQTRILWSERSFVYLATDSLENLSVCMFLLRWRIYPPNVLIGESQERRITIYDSPSLIFSLPSQSSALFLAKTTAEQCYNYSFELIPYCSFSSLQRLSRPCDIRYVCVSDICV